MTFGGTFASSRAFYSGRFSPNSSPLARYSLGGKAPAVVADTVAGVYGLGGRSVGFEGLFSFSRLSAAWKLNALGQWVKVLAGEPRTGHHIWKDGKLVPAGLAVCSEVRTNHVTLSTRFETGWSGTDVTVTANTHISPDGTINADTLTRSGEQGYLIKSAAGVTGQTKSIYARTVSGTGTVGLLSHNSVPASEVALTEEWQRFDLPVDTTETGGSNFYAVDFRVGDLTEVVVWGAQLEDGPYATDHIPTDGSAVSVAAETLEIDPVTMAKAVGVFGPELAGIAPTTVNAPWVDNGNGTFTIDGTQEGNNYLYWSGLLEASETYVIEAKVTDFVGSGTVGFVSATVSINFEVTGNGVYSKVISGGGANLNVNAKGNGFAGTVELLSVRKVTMPEVLTFVIKGFMTYEDGNRWSELVPFRLQNTDPTLEKIAFELSTLDARTGQMYFAHMSNSTLNAGTASADNKSPGVDVPFSYARTIGDGISAATSDGVLVTGNAPTPLANILGAVADFTYRGDFCLTEFAIYVGNPGSAALQEATA